MKSKTNEIQDATFNLRKKCGLSNRLVVLLKWESFVEFLCKYSRLGKFVDKLQDF